LSHSRCTAPDSIQRFSVATTGLTADAQVLTRCKWRWTSTCKHLTDVTAAAAATVDSWLQLAAAVASLLLSLGYRRQLERRPFT